MNKKLKCLFLILFILSGCVDDPDEKSVKERLQEFYETEIPESALVPYLVDGGKEMLPFLIRDVINCDTPKRRYIIGALGELKDTAALPALESILFDSSDKIYFRCDALKAISIIQSTYVAEISGKESKIIQTLEAECDRY